MGCRLSSIAQARARSRCGSLVVAGSGVDTTPRLVVASAKTVPASHPPSLRQHLRAFPSNPRVPTPPPTSSAIPPSPPTHRSPTPAATTSRAPSAATVAVTSSRWKRSSLKLQTGAEPRSLLSASPSPSTTPLPTTLAVSRLIRSPAQSAAGSLVIFSRAVGSSRCSTGAVRMRGIAPRTERVLGRAVWAVVEVATIVVTVVDVVDVVAVVVGVGASGGWRSVLGPLAIIKPVGHDERPPPNVFILCAFDPIFSFP